MRVAVEKVPGVLGAKVSLNEGRVEVRLAPANVVTVERLREAIRDQGFSPREAQVRVRGTVRLLGGAWFLELPGVETALEVLVPHGANTMEGLAGRVVVATGRIGDGKPWQLEVASAEASPGD